MLGYEAGDGFEFVGVDAGVNEAGLGVAEEDAVVGVEQAAVGQVEVGG